MKAHNHLKRQLLIMPAAFLCGIIFLFSSQAYAIPLTNWNVTELNTSGDYVEVAIGTSNGNTTLSVLWHPGASNLLTAIGIDMFGYNSSTSVYTCPTGWDCNKKATNMDGFGWFTKFEKSPASTDGISSPIVFVLNGTATFTPNSHNAEFAAHVRYGNNCSGFVSDGTTTSIGSNSNCGGKVPEPSTLLLLGAGLTGLWMFRRRFRKG